MIYLTGDTHGSYSRFREIEKFCKKNNTSKDDFLIILGDAGLNYYNDLRDTVLKSKISSLPITILCLHGNHEIRPQNLSSYREETMFDSTVFIESDFPSIIFFKDGEIYTIEDNTFLVLGGAYSVDKNYRLTMGYNWFSDEQISEEERKRILKKSTGKKFDYILSHTCPFEWRPTEFFLPSINQDEVDNTMELWLSDVERSIEYKKWFFGHYHGDKEKDNYRMFFNDIVALEVS